MTKRIVLSGYFGFKNFGDEAILSVLVDRLQKAKYSLTIISSDPQYTKSQYQHIRSVYTFDINNIIGFIAKSDVLISGGGSLLQDVTSIKSLLYYLFIISIGLFFNKKVIIFAQGIGPINNPFGKFLAKNILKHCSYISVRDKNSYELLKNWGINSDLLCDPIFSIKIPPNIKNESVAVQLRDFKTMTNDFIERLALKIHQTFPNIPIEIYSFQDTIDLDICKKFEKNIKMLNPDIKTTLYSGLTNKEIIEKLSCAKYLIAMRFHAIIIGLLAKCKTLAINYDIKVTKISDEFNLPLIELQEEFNDQFEQLKNQDTEFYENLISQKHFSWEKIDSAIQE